MSFQVDSSLHWTDHYVEHGFAVVKGAARPAFVEEALAEVRQLGGAEKPLSEWRKGDAVAGHHPYNGSNFDVLPRVYDEPGVRDVIDTMFGSPDEWNGERTFQLFVTAYDPDAEAKLSPQGHIDFVRCPIPVMGSGFMFQLSLVDSERFSGNITIYPGTHRDVQRRVIDNPAWRYPTDAGELPQVEPFEFVAEAGDMLLFHHLVLHNGNSNHAANRTPRVVIHGQGLRDAWLREVDPATARSPWERSLAVSGHYRAPRDEEVMMREHRSGG